MSRIKGFLIFIGITVAVIFGRGVAGAAGLSGDEPQTGGNLPAEVRFETISPADGLSFPIVRSILQDSLGFMWFATENGLNKFDGYTFTTYKNQPQNPNSLPFDEQRAIFRDSDGALWFGGAGGLLKFERDTRRFIPFAESGTVTCITEDAGGMLWVGFEHGLYGYDRNTPQPLYTFLRGNPGSRNSQTLSPGAVQAVLVDAQNYLWIGTSDGLDRLDPARQTFTHFRHDPYGTSSLNNNDILALFEDQQKHLWIGTNGGGLARLNQTTGTFERYRHDPADAHSLSSDVVLAILEDRRGNLWVGTVNGLNQRPRGSPQFFHYRHDAANPTSLSDNIVYDLYEDRAGVLWIATANGISRYIPRVNQFTYLRWPTAADPQDTATPPVDLGESKVLSVFEDQDGLIWFGTLINGLYRYDPQTGAVRVYRHDPQRETSLASDQIYAIYQDRVGVLWLGTGDGWLDQFDPTTNIFLHADQQDAEITAIAEDLTDTLWIGTQGNGLSHLKFDEQALSRFSDPAQALQRDSIGSTTIESLYVDQSGQTWVGTYDNGINLWDPALQRFKSYRNDPADPHSLSHNHVIAFWEAPSPAGRVMWIGTMGGGLNRFDPASESFTHYTTADGLADDIVNCILTDDAGILWLSTPKGLSRFDPVSGTFRNYDEGDGFSSGNSHPGVCLRSRTGQMYFGTPDGVIVFDPTQVQDNLQQPKVLVTRLLVNSQVAEEEIAFEHELRLSYWENSLAFEFSALDYTAPEKNQYTYQLQGLDADWVFAGPRRYADYPSLPPGDYVFRVKGSNNDGLWSEVSPEIRVSITPPFWTTGWFIGLVVFLIVGGVFIGARLRLRALETQRRELETQVVERTEEINRRRRQIEALYQADENLYRHLELDQVLLALVDTAVQLLNADKGSLLCWDDARENLVIHSAYGFSPETIARVRLPRGEGVAGWVTAHGHPVCVSDTHLEPRITPQIVEPENIRAFLQVPIMVGDEIFGVFSADYLQPREFDDEEQRLLIALAQRAAIAIQNAQLYSQAREVAATQERTRLARELHDAVTQTLFSANLIAEALPTLWERSPEKGRERLSKLRLMSRGALAEMRALLLELRPAALMESNLEDLLHQLGEAVTGREGVPVTVEVPHPCKLPNELHIALYRIAQEALNNIVKHARSTQVTIQLQTVCDPEGQLQKLELRVADDGRGFDPQQVAPERMGLNIMRERAQAVGAEFAVQSILGEGTVIMVTWAADGS